MNVNQTIKAGIGLSSGSGIGPLSADMTSKTALHDLWVQRGIIAADSWHEREVGTNNKRATLIVPKKWSDNACNIFYSKYIRKAGVPQINLFDRDEIWTPCEGNPNLDLPIQYGAEWSVHHTIHRLVERQSLDAIGFFWWRKSLC